MLYELRFVHFGLSDDEQKSDAAIRLGGFADLGHGSNGASLFIRMVDGDLMLESQPHFILANGASSPSLPSRDGNTAAELYTHRYSSGRRYQIAMMPASKQVRITPAETPGGPALLLNITNPDD